MSTTQLVATAQPTHLATARGLLFDTQGRWLLVRSKGAQFWHLPGGTVDLGESPAAACRRTFREEIGIDIAPGALHLVGWNPPRQPSHRSRLTFVFRMGILDPAIASAKIRVPTGELDSWQFVIPVTALSLLHPDAAHRLRVVWGAARGVYTEIGA